MAGLHGTKIANVSSSSASWRPPDKDLLPESDRGPPAQIPPWARSGARQCRRPVKACTALCRFERAGVKARTASPSKPIAAPLLFDNGPPRCCTRGHIQKPGGPATWSRHQKEMPRMRSNTARTASKNSKTHSTRHPLSKAPGRSSRAQLKEATAPAAESAVRAAEHGTVPAGQGHKRAATPPRVRVLPPPRAWTSAAGASGSSPPGSPPGGSCTWGHGLARMAQAAAGRLMLQRQAASDKRPRCSRSVRGGRGVPFDHAAAAAAAGVHAGCGVRGVCAARRLVGRAGWAASWPRHASRSARVGHVEAEGVYVLPGVAVQAHHPCFPGVVPCRIPDGVLKVYHRRRGSALAAHVLLSAVVCPEGYLVDVPLVPHLDGVYFLALRESQRAADTALPTVLRQRPVVIPER
mmetsp:Transcript_21657/g.61539  ORF Transcript_21657/g.61539 Transcript_21657/m.61539 type:complete len:408 (+) Transcript_21657:726-1949(+)